MRTGERLRALKSFLESAVCQGKRLKAPAPTGEADEIRYRAPEVYLGFDPAGPFLDESEISTPPSILIVPGIATGKYLDINRYDERHNINRPRNYSHTLSITLIFHLWDAGDRKPGYTYDGDTGLIGPGESGVETLLEWMDEAAAALLGQRVIPGSDMALVEETLNWCIRGADQGYIMDTRPHFYGQMAMNFQCYVNESRDDALEELLGGR